MRIYLFLIILAAFLIGCGGNNTELRWDNDSSSDVRDIQWHQNNKVDQTWNAECKDGTKTPSKEVNLLTGQGECFDIGAGDTSEMWFGSAKTATLTEGEANELTITRLAKKKKNREETEIETDGLIIKAKVVDRE